jgi:peptide/nickel transport system permease protein
MATTQERAASQTEALVEAGGAHRSLRGDVWRQFRRHKGAVAGLILLTAIVLFSVVGPFVYTVSPFTTDIPNASLNPSWERPMGTDNLGRDVMARMMIGGRISLAVGITAMIVGVIMGTSVGILAGFFKRLDGPLMRLTDMFLALPVLPLLLVIIMLFRESLQSALGPQMGIFVLVVAIIGATSWMTTSRVVRSQVLAVKQQEFVIAATSIGTRRRNMVFRHILPNVLSPVMVAAALGVAVAIITESALSFLGLGFPPSFPTWGGLLQEARDFLQISPMRVVWPGLFISLTVISVNFIGDGLRDALDPRLRSN